MYFWLYTLFYSTCLRFRNSFISFLFIPQEVCLIEPKWAIITDIFSFESRHTFDDIFMPVSRRGGIDRSPWVAPARELIDSLVVSEPSVIHNRRDGTNTSTRSVIITSIAAISISDIPNIATGSEVLPESTFCKSNTEDK